MKKNKIIGISVASLGVLLSLGGAIALYQTGAENVGFDIGSFTGTTGQVSYLVNNASSGKVDPAYCNADGTPLEGKKLGSEGVTQVLYEFNLKATYGNSLIAQPYVVGNASVNISNIAASLQNHAKVWIDVAGYEANTLGEHYYNHSFMNSDTAITESTYTAAKDIVVEANGGQKVRVWFKLDNFEGNLLELNEGKAFDISFTWTGAADFEYAYLQSDKNSWKDDDGYRMVPNIKANYNENKPYEWMFQGLTGATEARCHKGENWSGEGNENLDASKKYNFYWDGTQGGSAGCQEQSAE